MSVLLWLSNTPAAVWARETDSVWGYPTILFLHTLGLGILVGLTTAVDFRVLGFAERLPLAPLDRFFRLIWVGFWINAISGAGLLIITPSKLVNPAFFFKMAFIAAGVVDLWWLRREAFGASADGRREGVTSRAKLLAASSLAFWAGAITAGRLMAYVGSSH
jgi:hypothetical protein